MTSLKKSMAKLDMMPWSASSHSKCSSAFVSISLAEEVVCSEDWTV